MLQYRIISIGTLSFHELWKDNGPVRTAHATCVLVTSGDVRILVDPGLPPQAITARLQERAGLSPDDIDMVFVTSFRPAHTRGLAAFPNAKWYISEAEREQVGTLLIDRFQQEQEQEAQEVLRQEVALLRKMMPAPDELAEKVSLFPLPGFTPGTCGLLLSHTNKTTLLVGDAIATVEHLEQGRVLRNAYDVEQARESLMEALEIADVIIPGHDNVVHNPVRHF